MPTTHVLYLHGFRSSPRSTKASLMAQAVARRFPAVVWSCPQLPPSPLEASRVIAQCCAGWPQRHSAVIGSSLGGFYATWVAEQLMPETARVVLLNPAVDPARDLSRHIGTHTAWHDPRQSFDFTAAHVAELGAMATGPVNMPERYLAVIAKGDEVLDWREMAGRYEGCQIRLLEGSDHAISDFGEHLEATLSFLDLE